MYFWFIGKEGMEKKMEITTWGLWMRKEIGSDYLRLTSDNVTSVLGKSEYEGVAGVSYSYEVVNRGMKEWQRRENYCLIRNNGDHYEEPLLDFLLSIGKKTWKPKYY